MLFIPFILYTRERHRGTVPVCRVLILLSAAIVVWRVWVNLSGAGNKIAVLHQES